MDFIWDCITLPPGHPNHINATEPSIDSILQFKWSDKPVQSVAIMFGSEPYFLFNYQQEPHLAQLYSMYPPANYRHVSSIHYADTPVSRMLAGAQNRDYLCYKLIVVIHEVGKLFEMGLTPRETNFIYRYWNRYTYLTLRHAIKVGGYDIKWHRDSTVIKYSSGSKEGILFGTDRMAGFVTSGIYINRPQGLPSNEAGISFIKDNKIHSIFPQGGTVVTFLDTEVFHRVVPLAHAGTAEVRNGYVKRSAAFMEHFTTKQIVEAQMEPSATFNKVSIPSQFRNIESVYRHLTNYFSSFRNRLPANLKNKNMNMAISTAPEHVISDAYHYMPEGYQAYVASITAAPLVPPADFFVYKVKGKASNMRGKLKNLHTLYQNLRRSFSGAHINSANFVKYLNTN
jgi:hypothetical protein